MKTLELDLKKKVLIVDLPEGYEFIAIGNDKEIYYAIKLDENYTKISNGKEWKFICKGLELTEEIASEFFEYDDFLNRFESYIDTVPSIDKSALKLFIKIFESKGFYWFENPIEKPKHYDIWAKYGDYTQYGKKLTEECLKWKESEEKTFRNPLIFVKK